jgi:hypothetical protein
MFNKHLISSIQNSTQNSGKQGVTKRCRLSWLTNSALVYEPKCVRKGGGGVEGSLSQPEYSCANGAQRNFGDLTQKLTYDGKPLNGENIF